MTIWTRFRQQSPQRFGEPTVSGGHGHVGFRHHCNIADQQLILASLGAANAEPCSTANADLNDSRLRHIAIHDFGQGTERLRFCGRPDFGATFDQTHAEGRPVPETRRNHVQVASFEDAQVESSAGKQDRPKRKERQVFHDRLSPRLCRSRAGRLSKLPLLMMST